MRGEYARAVTEGLGGFEAPGELLKAWDEEGVWRFEGVAATGGLDRQSERLTANALGKIARSQGVELRAAHRAGRIGVVEECWVSGDEVRVRGKLEGHSAEAAAVYTRLRRGERLGPRLGAKVTGARWVWDAEVERPVRMIEDVELSHVAVCKAEEAVNPGTWVRPLTPQPPLPCGEAAAGEGENGVLPPLRGSEEEGAEAQGLAPLARGWRAFGAGEDGETGEAETAEEARRPTPSPSLKGGEPEAASEKGGSSDGGETTQEATTDAAGRRGTSPRRTEEGGADGALTPRPSPTGRGEPETATAGQVAGPSDGGETAGAAGDVGGEPVRRPTPSPSLKGGGPEAPEKGGSSHGGETEDETPEAETAEGAAWRRGTSPRPTEEGGAAGAETQGEMMVVRRGEPQGLSGSFARPVIGTRIWEGVL